MELDGLVGKNVSEVFWTTEELGFTFTDGTYLAYSVYEGCCSYSYLHDFYGVAKLIDNGPVISVRSLEEKYYQLPSDGTLVLKCYGWEIVTEHLVWGEQTSVFSFRNESNGSYGGWICENPRPSKDLWQCPITEDVA